MAKSDYPVMLWNAAGENRVFNAPEDVPAGEDWRDSHPVNWAAAPQEAPSAPRSDAPATKRRPVRLNAPE